ncbi:MAG TPA: DUF1653 domain-containing protein [Candidatus Paceibacterota bacterium]|nr:DUF1653 domain-containing protein [Candidatus Paceibacterota bacterium]
MELKPGLYEHFKGGKYRVLGTARHSETLEELALYEHDGQFWVRPLAMFLERVEREGKTMPRFRYSGP